MGSKKNQPELDKELTQISKPKLDTYDRQRLDKLFSKLDLSGCDKWSEGAAADGSRMYC